METNPVAEVSNSSIEAKLAAAFERGGLKDPEPPAIEEDDESEAVVEASDDGEPEAEAQTDEPTDDAELVEYEGKSYQLPKELKDALLRQQDYTKKTQSVAEERRAIEDQKQAVEVRAKFIDAHSEKMVEARALHNQLQQFAQIDWAGLAETNPAQYLQLDRQQRTLAEAANRVNAEIQQLNGEFQGQLQQTKQKAQAKCIEELKRDFKDFGPEFLKSLDDTGKSFGFSGEELASIADPRMVRVLHAAMQYKKLQGSKSLVEKKVQDAKPVQVRAARSAQTSQANAQLADLKHKAAKTGKTSDVEAYLAASFAKRMK